MPMPVCAPPPPSLIRCWLCLLALLPAIGCSAPPQIGDDAETLKAADSLWTAVTARDSKLLEQSAGSVAAAHDAGKLPAEGYAYLQDIIVTARDGKWDKARDRLKKLIKAQRREDKRAVKHGA